MSDIFESSIIIDNGSYKCRMGFVFDEAPRAVFKNCIGRPFTGDASSSTYKDELYVGSGALQERRELLNVVFPVERGIVTDWDAMEKIWDYCFSKEFRVSPNEFPVMISEAPLNPRANAETMAQVMFEKFEVPFFRVGEDAPSIYTGVGRDSGGMIVNIGHGVTYVNAQYEGHGPIATLRSDFGGADLTKYLQHALAKRGYNFTTSWELDMLSDLKKEACIVKQEEDSELLSSEIELTDCSSSFNLSDGSAVELGAERWKCPELLFQPDGVFNQGPSLTDMILECHQRVCATARDDMTIILSGGVSLCKGMKERLMKSLKSKIRHRVRVYAPSEREYSLWLGQLCLGSLVKFEHLWISKQHYEEFGPSCVHEFKSKLYEEWEKREKELELEAE